MHPPTRLCDCYRRGLCKLMSEPARIGRSHADILRQTIMFSIAAHAGSAMVYAMDISTVLSLAYLRDHVVNGRALMPGTG